MKKIYPYVNLTRANADGSYSVFLIVKGSRGRFFVNTGLTTCDRLVDRTFPKGDSNWKRKTTLLGKYLADVEALCISADIAGLNDTELKLKIQSDVFGLERRRKTSTLADVVRLFADTKKEQTAAIYEVTARKVRDYDESATLDADAEWLDGFRSYWLDRNMAINGIAKDLRNIRATFNWARRKGLTANYPFLDFKIASEETIPNNISVEQLRRLRDYPCESWQKPYVDFFFLSFYLAGINPVDLLSLKKEDYKDGYISFVRRKTNKQGANIVRTITLPVLPEAKEIIDRYPSQEGWLLGFMDSRNSYRSFARGCNDALQKVGPSRKVKDKVGKLRKIEYEPICPDITLYSARYSFGSIAANDLDISERTIGLCLGHSWANSVTCRYVAHDQRKIDAAIRAVIDFFFEYI
jgi:integrase